MANAKVQVCWAYEDAAPGDGTRVLVDRSCASGTATTRSASGMRGAS